MQNRLFGPTHREVSVIGQGNWFDGNDDPATVINALRLGVELGMNHIDITEMNGAHAAERLVGKAIAGRREQVFLVSKVVPRNDSQRSTIQACERTLKRLKTDRLDCYLLDWRGRYLLEETVAEFEQLRKEGKILSWGVSNFDIRDLEDVWKIAGDLLACDQILYHLQERAAEHAVIPWCQKHKVAIVAYSPLGRVVIPGPRSTRGRVLHDVAQLHHATSRQVALQFLVRSSGLFAIVKAGDSQRAAENAGAGQFQLSAAEVASIDKVFPPGARTLRQRISGRKASQIS